MSEHRIKGQPGLGKLPVVTLSVEDNIPVVNTQGEQGVVPLRSVLEMIIKTTDARLTEMVELLHTQQATIGKLEKTITDRNISTPTNYANTEDIVHLPDGIYYNEEGVFNKQDQKITKWKQVK